MEVTDARSQKVELRRESLALRNGLPTEQRQAAGRRVCELLFSSPLLDEQESLMLYAAVGSEVATRPMFDAARARGHRVAFPRVIKGRRSLEAAWVDSYDDMSPGGMGILEPAPSVPAANPLDIQVIIVPGVAFDRRGYRVGYGAGYYDRFLPSVQRALRIGLTYESCVYHMVPAEPHDQRVHWLLTEVALCRL